MTMRTNQNIGRLSSKTTNGKRKITRAKSSLPRTISAKRLVREMYGGEPYEYFALGKHIVAAPGVCGGRPTFKYTRIRVDFILDLLATGRSIQDLTKSYSSSALTEEAIMEALELARHAFVQVMPVARVTA